MTNPPVGSWLTPEWREEHPKEALACDLLVELGFDPQDVLSGSTRVRGVLDVEGDRCVRITVLDRNDRGGVHLMPLGDGSFTTAKHVEFVDVDPERLARYCADVAAL